MKLKVWENWTDLPDVQPPGNFTNQTLIDDQVKINDYEPPVKIKVDHSIDVGYKGEYDSYPVTGVHWNLKYWLNAYGTIRETITINIASWYEV